MSAENGPLRIAAIIANYNGAKHVGRCLETLLASKTPNVEILVVDDASTDESVEVIKRFPVRLIRLKRNVGSGRARDLGVQRSEGDVVFFLDADTEMPSDVFERIDRAIRLEGYDGVIGVVSDAPLGGGMVSRWLAHETHYLGMRAPADAPHQFFIALCGAMKRSVYLANGGMFHRVLDDMEFSSRLEDGVRLKTDTGWNFRHRYDGFRGSFAKLLRRSFHYGRLDRRPAGPWFTRARTWGVIAAWGSVVSLPAALLWPPCLLLSAAALAAHLGCSARFHLETLRRGGVRFALGSILLRYVFSVAIGMGVAAGLLSRAWEELTAALIRMSGPLRIYVRRGSPTYAIIYVTALCNSRCRYCFQYEILNEPQRQRAGLTLGQYVRLAKSMGPMEHITLGGGEPFLRRDLADIAIAFYRYTGVRNISIPTNGAQPEILRAQAEKMLANCPNAIIKISLSIDGVGPEHDTLRGFPGNYEKLVESDQVLRQLRRTHENLYYIINTCFNHYNQNTVLKTILENRRRFDHDIQVTTFVRGSIAEDEAKDVDINAYFDVVDYLEHIQTIERKPHGYRLELMHNALQVESRSAITKVLSEHEGKYACTAGTTMVVIDDVGNVNPCEILPGKFSYGNLRDFEMNLPAIMRQQRVKGIQGRIKKERCFCTWECAQLNSIAFSPKGLLNLAKGMFALGKRRKRLEHLRQAGSPLDFETFTKAHARPRITELPGAAVHPMVLEGDTANSFNIENSLRDDGTVMTQAAMTDAEQAQKKRRWLAASEQALRPKPPAASAAQPAVEAHS